MDKTVEKNRQIHKQEHLRKEILINPTTWKRVKMSQRYEEEDIITVASCLLDTHGYDFQKQLHVLSSEGQLKNWLKSDKNFNVHQNAYFCLYKTQRRHWVLFSIMKGDSNILILYKDPHGGVIVPEIQNTIADKYKNHEFKIHLENKDEATDSCSPMCLKNLEIILEGLNEKKDEFIEQFVSTEFCSSLEEVSKIKEQFQALLKHYVNNNILLWIEDLSNQSEFITCMNDFIDKCTKYVDVKDVLFNYTDEIMKEFSTDNPEINHEKLTELRGKFFGNEFTQELISSCSINSNVSFNENVSRNEIEEKFPEQMKTFQTVFSWIINYKDNAERDDLLQIISDAMGLEYNKIKLFFELQRVRKGCSDQSTEGNGPEELPSVEELVQELPLESASNICETGVKNMDKLLQELELGDTWKAKAEESNGDGHKDMLRRVLSKVHQERDRREEDLKKIIKHKEKALKIRTWAMDRRSRSSQMGQEEISEQDVIESLAIICCAHQLVTSGQELRDTQLLAALLCVLCDKGNLCQMATGEGKTAVISMLAAVELLLHNRIVDIITSNHVLAYEGFKSRRIFYKLLGITVSCSSPKHEGEYRGHGARRCYTADVVYGDIATFQFDFLRHHLEQQGTRGDRYYGRVIADEVDCMLIDHASHIAKLCSPFPGMDSLRYVLIKIWQAVYKSEDVIMDIHNKKLKEKAEKIEQKVQAFDQELKAELAACVISIGPCMEELLAKNKTLEQKKDAFLKACQMEYDQYGKKVLEEEIDKTKQRIKDLNPSKLDIIPCHLRAYAEQMEDQWIDSALHAMYYYAEGVQYVLRTDDVSKETVVVLVDWENTGVTQKNTVLCNGLHQFIQFKHNIRVDPESLTCCYISNVTYIKMYGKYIWGLTGTMGSNAETQLLACIYEVSYAKIPTYRIKIFIEYNGLVVPNDQWANAVSTATTILASSGRSVLIICRTINDGMLLKMNIKALLNLRKIENILVKTYFDENSSEIVEEVVGPRQIIVATNIAGRGTDLKTDQFLEDNGGLHVCVAFLPANQRVQDQAYGRTGRQGNMGSAQMILRHNDVLELSANISPNADFSMIMKTRDEMEETRVLKVQNEELRNILFQDAIFTKFCNVYIDLRKQVKQDVSVIFLTRDLKELWAFWLHKKDFSKTTRTVDEEFQDFLQRAERVLGRNEDGVFKGGEVAFNPYYGIQQADYFLTCGSIEKSEKTLLNVLHNLDPENSHILYSAYFKLFEVEMEKGHQLFERFKKAMKDIVNIVNIPIAQKDETYKLRASNALKNAIEALEKEMNYIKINFMGNSFDSTDLLKNQEVCSSNKDFINILIPPLDKNFLIKQLSSRYTVLSSFHQHAVNLLKQVKESSNRNDSTKGLAIISRGSNFLKEQDPTTESTSPTMQEALSEIGLLGLDTMYALREIHDVPEEIISAARRQIVAGLAVSGYGVIFPPALIITGPLGSTLISEGICDIVIEVINQGYGEFCEEAYVRGKVISYAISVITLGISALSQSVTLLDKAIQCCKSLSSILRKCPYLKSVCEKLASIIDSLGKYFQKLKYLSQVNKLSTTTLAMSKMELLGLVIRNTGKTTMRSLVGSVISEKIVNAQLNMMLTRIKPDIEIIVEDIVKEKIMKKGDLNDISRTDLQYQLNKILGTYKKSDILIEVVLGLLRHSSSWCAKLSSIVIDTAIFSSKIKKYAGNVCEKLKEECSKPQEETLQNIQQKVGNNRESFEELQNVIIKSLSDKIYSLLMQITGKYVNTFAVNPVMNKYWNLFDSPAKAQEQSNKKFYEISEALELLGLDYGATDEEINRAYDQSNSSEGNTEQSICISEARNILLDLNKQVASYEILCNSKEPAHRGNVETLSKESKRHIVIHVNETGETLEFGMEYKDSGNPTMNIRYESPSGDGSGHYSVMETDKIEVQASGDYNCFYDVYAAICNSEGKDMTPEHARSMAETYSWSNLYYGTLNSVSEGFNNDMMKKMYLESKTALLVGGNDEDNTEPIIPDTSNTEPIIPDTSKSLSDLMVEYPDAFMPFITD